jgi:flagellar P-ring protein precursor FlgI
MGVLITPSTVEVKNVAAVFVTAMLPPFARPGARLDVTVSSVGDAKSLEGGVLLMSALHGPDGQVYAEAQGPLQMGGYTAGTGTNGKQVNSTTVGMVSDGGIVERDTAVDLSGFKTISLLLRNPDFSTAKQIADAVNNNFHKPLASALEHQRRASRRRIRPHPHFGSSEPRPHRPHARAHRHQRAHRHHRPRR